MRRSFSRTSALCETFPTPPLCSAATCCHGLGIGGSGIVSSCSSEGSTSRTVPGAAPACKRCLHCPRAHAPGVIGDRLVLAALGELLASRGLPRGDLHTFGLTGLCWQPAALHPVLHRTDCVFSPVNPPAFRPHAGLGLAEMDTARRCGECDEDLPSLAPPSRARLRDLAISLDFVLSSTPLLPGIEAEARVGGGGYTVAEILRNLAYACSTPPASAR